MATCISSTLERHDLHRVKANSRSACVVFALSVTSVPHARAPHSAARTLAFPVTDSVRVMITRLLLRSRALMQAASASAAPTSEVPLCIVDAFAAEQRQSLRLKYITMMRAPKAGLSRLVAASSMTSGSTSTFDGHRRDQLQVRVDLADGLRTLCDASTRTTVVAARLTENILVAEFYRLPRKGLWMSITRAHRSPGGLDDDP